MSAKAKDGSRGYHPTNMPRRDARSQQILNRLNGKEVKDKCSVDVKGINAVASKEIAETKKVNSEIVNEIIPGIVKRQESLENTLNSIQENMKKSNEETGAKFDALLKAIAGGKSPDEPKPAKASGKNKLPPAEK